MPQIVQFPGPHRVDLADVAPMPLNPGSVRVATWYSGISAGTELTAYRGTNPYLTSTWDTGRRLFVAGAPSFGYPVQGWGYSEVGQVVEVADDVDAPRVGDVVHGIWGHRSDVVLPATALAWRVLPPDVDPVLGTFARVGSVALANPRRPRALASRRGRDHVARAQFPSRIGAAPCPRVSTSS